MTISTRPRTTLLGAVVAIVLLAATTFAGEASAVSPSTSALTTAATTSRAAAVGTLSIPRLGGVGMPVVSVGSSGGAIGVPVDADQVGWWRGSVRFEGIRGSSIIVGHVSDQADAPGAFFKLGSLRKGDRLTWRVGKTQKTFKVVAKTYTPRAGDLPDRIWQKGGPRMVHLVSCARRVVFDDGGYHYTHNITVSARLVSKRAR